MASVAVPLGAQQRGGNISSLFSAHQGQGRARYPRARGSCASQGFLRAQKAAAKCHGLAVIIPGRQSVRASSIPGICLGRSQQWSHQRRRSSSTDKTQPCQNTIRTSAVHPAGTSCWVKAAFGNPVLRVRCYTGEALSVASIGACVSHSLLVFALLIAEMQSTGGFF